MGGRRGREKKSSSSVNGNSSPVSVWKVKVVGESSSASFGGSLSDGPGVGEYSSASYEGSGVGDGSRGGG